VLRGLLLLLLLLLRQTLLEEVGPVAEIRLAT
jgi:hypothetical protein